MEQRKENIVMFPFMAQGHIRPFLALAFHIVERKNCTVSFINTPLNIKKLRPSLPSNSSIRLLEIPFSSTDHGLPPDAENTDAFPHLIGELICASHSFKPSFTALISNLIQEQNGHRPLCIIADMFFSWTAKVAHEFGVFNAIFAVGDGYGMGVLHTLWLNLPHLATDSKEFPLPGFPESCRIRLDQIPEYLKTIKPNDSFVKFQQRLCHDWVESDALLFNTVEEFDHIGLTYFRQQIKRPVWPIGPVQLSMESKAGSWELYKNWLDSKASGSVLYISFGSQSTISMSQMMELAKALEASGKDFIWVIRPPLEFDINSEFNAEEWLPKGFEQRVVGEKNKGLLVHKWAPQVEILSNKSVGVFLSHCGWNSVLDSLSHGVPIMGWPMTSEQHFNAKKLEEEMGVCIEVANGGSCEVRHEDIVAKIKLVMNETEKGKDMTRKAGEVMEMLKNAKKDEDGFTGSSLKAIDEFFNAALLQREKTTMSHNNGKLLGTREVLSPNSLV
uniref:Glycosyltransferase n=1 Tax=Fagus sylvatica TaxID=28930 RepID=A0A2N9HTZ2_FAGSY